MNFTNTDLAKVIAYNRNSQDATYIAQALAEKFQSEGFTPILEPCTRGRRLKTDLENLMRDSTVQNEELKNKPTYYRTLPPTEGKSPRSGQRQKIERVVLIDLNPDRDVYEYLDYNPGTLEIRNVYAPGVRVVNRVTTDGVEIVTRVDEIKSHRDTAVSLQVALVTAYDVGLTTTSESALHSSAFKHLSPMSNVEHIFQAKNANPYATQILWDLIAPRENLWSYALK